MTMSATWYPSTDGLFYPDPTWADKDYVVHLDEDGSIIYIKTDSKIDPNEILTKLGFKFDRLRMAEKSKRMFKRGEKWSFCDAIMYRFHLTEKIPTPHGGGGRKDVLKGEQWTALK